MKTQVTTAKWGFLTRKSVILGFLTIELIILLFVVFRNFSFDYLWYDESGQFWLAKGLNHDSPPLSPEGSLSDVIHNNGRYNMDPGGFSILLFWWTKISNSIIWMRMLPFFFLVGISSSCAYIIYKFFNNKLLTFLALFLPFVYPVLLNMGFEIRAYSMEVFFTLMAVVASIKLQASLTFKNLIILGCLISFGMCSRYSAIIIAFAASVLIVYTILKSENSAAKKLFLLVAYCTPIFITLIAIYNNALFHQNKHLGQLTYLQYISNNWSLLYQPINLAYFSLLTGLTVLQVKQKDWLKTEAYNSLLFLCLFSNVLYIILSAAGLHPWRIGSKGNISVNFLLIVCVFVMILHVLKNMPKSLRYTKLITALCFPAFIIYGYNRYLFPKHSESPYPRQDMHSNTTYRFDKLDTAKHRRIFVESWESPYIRYEFEYGKMKHLSSIYPSRFTFGTGVPHYLFPKKIGEERKLIPPPSMDELQQYDLIISSELYDWSHHHHQHWQLIKDTHNFWEKKQ